VQKELGKIKSVKKIGEKSEKETAVVPTF